MATLEQKLEQLKLSTLSQHLEAILKEAATKNLSFAATLESLVDLELEARNRRAVERRFHLSRLHAQPTIDTFHFQHHKSRVQSKSRDELQAVIAFLKGKDFGVDLQYLNYR